MKNTQAKGRIIMLKIALIYFWQSLSNCKRMEKINQSKHQLKTSQKQQDKNSQLLLKAKKNKKRPRQRNQSKPSQNLKSGRI
jgi:murein L,D-transpeptidase YafK